MKKGAAAPFSFARADHGEPPLSGESRVLYACATRLAPAPPNMAAAHGLFHLFVTQHPKDRRR